MDLVSKTSQALSPITSLKHNSSSSSETSFPIIAIAIIGILATAFLLLGYYIFVIKCCLNWHRIDIFRMRRLSMSRRRTDIPLTAAYNSPARTGLDECVIQSIPLFQYKKGSEFDFFECAVCLNEFLEDEKLRRIPNCSHFFHIDCIDVWLQNNDNCPLCRTSISTWCAHQYIDDRFTSITPSSTPQESDYIVIELGDHGQNSGISSTSTTSSIESKRSRRKFSKLTSMGDECINKVGSKDEEFGVQPIRRSFSMDSSCDRQLYLAVQEIVQNKNKQVIDHQVSSEGCSSSGRVRRMFSFGHHKSSRSASVLPVYLED
ncbi:hypothetical protein ACFE04_012633 [Oxalis oulophora]